MHEWCIRKSTDIDYLKRYFKGYQHDSDNGYIEIEDVRMSSRVFKTYEEASSYIQANTEYDGRDAIIVTVVPNKTSKAYDKAKARFEEVNKDYTKFKKALNVGYGRKSDKVTCPHCGSAISVKYGGRYTECPVCGSTKIISDSNWNTLKTKENMVKKAAAKMEEEATKCGIYYVGGSEWHC